MRRLSAEDVQALAPDPGSLSAARELANASKWHSSGSSEAAIWGEAKGSGSKPYQTAVDLSDLASKCSCPSRKFPCKHALGLLLRFSRGELSVAEPPVWAQEWLDRRRQSATKSESAPTARPSPQVGAKTAEKRWGKILAGLDECEAFLSDQVAQGLISAGLARSWDQMAARMVDAQAPGIARRLRSIGSTIGVGPDWGAKAAAQLGSLALLMQAARIVEGLGDPLSADVRTAVGIPQRKDELSAEDAVYDVWDVFGQIMETEDRLTTCRTWLRGRGSGRWACYLAFAPFGQPPPTKFLPGHAVAAGALFFPSAWPLRAEFDNPEILGFEPRPGANWAANLDWCAQARSENPWCERVPVHVTNASLGVRDERWYAVDGEGLALPLRSEVQPPWSVLASTGNAPAELFGELDGEQFQLLAAWCEGRFVSLT